MEPEVAVTIIQTSDPSTIALGSRPIVIRGLSIGRCRSLWKDNDYLRWQIPPDKRVSVYVSQTGEMNFIERNFDNRTLTFHSFLDRCTSKSPPLTEYFVSNTEKYYLCTTHDSEHKMATLFEEHFPGLSKDVQIPNIFPSDRLITTVLDGGSANIRLGTHYESTDQMMIQIVGRKTVVLFDPSDAPYLYMKGEISEVIDVDTPDLARYPLFAQAKRYCARLEPGDILFIPSNWLYNVVFEDFSLTVDAILRSTAITNECYETNDACKNTDSLSDQGAFETVEKALKLSEELLSISDRSFNNAAVMEHAQLFDQSPSTLGCDKPAASSEISPAIPPALSSDPSDASASAHGRYVGESCVEKTPKAQEDALKKEADHKKDDTITIVGGGQTPQSFDERSDGVLSEHWPDWRHTDPAPVDERRSQRKRNTKSLVVPLNFTFKNPHFANADIQHANETNEMRRSGRQPRDSIQKRKPAYMTKNDKPPGDKDIKDRQADEAEYLVYKAISQVADDNQHHFMAIHSLDLDPLKVEALRKEIFVSQPDPDPKIYGEHDFVLIGPKIGIICIEVKSKDVRMEGPDGKANYEKKLKPEISKASGQLGCFEDAVRFLTSKYCPSLSDAIKVKKVIAIPNADNRVGQQTTIGCADTGGIRHWFKNERKNAPSDALKADYYTTMKQLLDELERKGLANGDAEKWIELYESLTPALLGLKLLLKVPNQIQRDCDIINRTLTTQSHLRRQADELKQHDIEELKRRGQLAGNVSKYVLLNLDQQKALNGGLRQFVVGAPGTGKTIILQEKISRLLAEGKNVMVFTTENFISSYRSLLDTSKENNMYDVQSLMEKDLCEFFQDHHYQPNLVTVPPSMFHQLARISGGYPIDKQFDAIMIDDSLEQYAIPDADDALNYRRRALIVVIWIMMQAPPSTLVWAAIDPFVHYNPYDRELCKKRLRELLRDAEQRGFEITKLHRVMRCSRNVFDVAFDAEVKQNMFSDLGDDGSSSSGFELPISGHLVVGPETQRVEIKPSVQDMKRMEQKGEEGLERVILWPQVLKWLKTLRTEGYQWGSIAVICGQGRNEDVAKIIANEVMRENSRRPSSKIPMVTPVHHSYSKNSCDSGITIANWHEVASNEWQVVVFVSAARNANGSTCLSYQKYRACSRATSRVMLIE